MDEEMLRNIAADNMAQGFIVELLLADHLKKFGPFRDNLAQHIFTVGQRTDHYFGLAKDDATAEVFSDVVIRMHASLEGYLERALGRLGPPAERSAAEPPQS